MSFPRQAVLDGAFADIKIKIINRSLNKKQGEIKMTTLLKNGTLINVFTGCLEKTNVLIEDGKITGVGDYYTDADKVEDVTGKYLCPGFIDGHIHIESTTLNPSELARVTLPHGTTSLVADPHEIANVSGVDGIKYILEASEGIPLNVYVMLPSCVPAAPMDESGAVLTASDLSPLYKHPRVIGLAEMMNYVGVLCGDEDIKKKIADAAKNRRTVDGHAPLLSGEALDKYISAGIQTDHECSTYAEATEKIRKGQWVMVREGTVTKNLEGLIELFERPYSDRCLLVTDDRHPADLISEGHIDNIIRLAVKKGKSAITAIQMATLHAAQCFGLSYRGAIAPGYTADILVLNDIDTVDIKDVYTGGKKIVDNKTVSEIKAPSVSAELTARVLHSLHLDELKAEDFYIQPSEKRCRVIKTVKNQVLTDEWLTEIDFGKNNGVDTERDILKLAVIERHKNTGHRGVGFISGIGLKEGAIASTVSHDSHNLIVIGANDADMALAANHLIEIGGGYVAVRDGRILADMPLPIAGLMTFKSAQESAEENRRLRETVYTLGVPKDIAPLMTMSFVSLSVIPSVKMTTRGLVDVNTQKLIPLYE